MGIVTSSADLCERELFPKLPAGFSVCELGNQIIRSTGRPAREWYERNGCGKYVCLDGNGDDGAIIVDLNQPICLGETFDLVTDFGTGEHCFDQARVWRTVHDLTKAGGWIVIERPKAGWDDHCFYSVHDCLVKDLAAANGYQITYMDTHAYGRGANIVAIMRKTSGADFAYPLQGKYRSMLKAIS